MSTSQPRLTAARLGAGLALAVGALALSGCSATNPVLTNEPYAASDGVNQTLGPLSFGNLLVLAAERDAPGTLLGSVTNASDRVARVEIGLAGTPTTVEVPAGATVILGPEATPVDLGTVPVPPGALVEVMLGSDADGTTSVQAPVLDGTLEYYATLVPEA